ncbi:hypothetical protein BLA29_000392 [Euroglyphus maynei]|uniref:Uncharacterized protein n=1 Tax=Euroglyphus maynei TaxID=6958 RepID=A0A1Y3B5E1_EURMA|nr:hypothetical protein BLA29_000392 [Euroglyphus maynei]
MEFCSSQHHQTTMSIWKEEFQTFSQAFIDSIRAFCSVHYRNDCEQDCHLGYIIQTKHKQTYVFGETLCRWLSLPNDSLQQLTTLNGKIIKQVDYGLDFFVILTMDGSVYLASSDPCWQTDRKLRWIETGIEKIACGHEHLLLLGSDRRLMAMGWNGLGQTTGTAQHSHRSPVFTGLENVEKIACGWAHSLALTDTGRLYSWGLNESGRLGLNDEMNRNVPSEIEFTGEDDYQIKDFVAGAAHTLFLMKNGALYGCGWNDNGELGSPDFDQFELSPIRLPIENVEAIATGWSYRFTIAFTNDGSCYVWGEFGQDSIRLYHPTRIMADHLSSSWSFSAISSLYFDPPLTFGWCGRKVARLKVKQLNFAQYSQRIQCDPEHDYVSMMVKRFSITSDHSLTFP